MRNNKEKERFLHYVIVFLINKNNELNKAYLLRDNKRYENTFKN